MPENVRQLSIQHKRKTRIKLNGQATETVHWRTLACTLLWWQPMQEPFRATANEIVSHVRASHSHSVRLNYSEQLHRRRRMCREFCLTITCYFYSSNIEKKIDANLINIHMIQLTISVTKLKQPENGNTK